MGWWVERGREQQGSWGERLGVLKFRLQQLWAPSQGNDTSLPNL